jgi:hypothetical protein
LAHDAYREEVRQRVKEILEEIPQIENPCKTLKKARKIGLTKLETQLLEELCKTEEDTTLDHIQFIISERESLVRERLRKLGF